MLSMLRSARLFLACWVAQGCRLFRSRRLGRQSRHTFRAPRTAIQAMLAGEAPIVLAGGEPVVESVLKGGDAVYIGGISIVPAVHFMALPEIRTVQDLRGKPVGRNALRLFDGFCHAPGAAQKRPRADKRRAGSADRRRAPRSWRLRFSAVRFSRRRSRRPIVCARKKAAPNFCST